MLYNKVMYILTLNFAKLKSTRHRKKILASVLWILLTISPNVYCKYKEKTGIEQKIAKMKQQISDIKQSTQNIPEDRNKMTTIEGWLICFSPEIYTYSHTYIFKQISVFLILF